MQVPLKCKWRKNGWTKLHGAGITASSRCDSISLVETYLVVAHALWHCVYSSSMISIVMFHFSGWSKLTPGDHVPNATETWSSRSYENRVAEVLITKRRHPNSLLVLSSNRYVTRIYCISSLVRRVHSNRWFHVHGVSPRLVEWCWHAVLAAGCRPNESRATTWSRKSLAAACGAESGIQEQQQQQQQQHLCFFRPPKS